MFARQHDFGGVRAEYTEGCATSAPRRYDGSCNCVGRRSPTSFQAPPRRRDDEGARSLGRPIPSARSARDGDSAAESRPPLASRGRSSSRQSSSACGVWSVSIRSAVASFGVVLLGSWAAGLCPVGCEFAGGGRLGACTPPRRACGEFAAEIRGPRRSVVPSRAGLGARSHAEATPLSRPGRTATRTEAKEEERTLPLREIPQARGGRPA